MSLIAPANKVTRLTPWAYLEIFTKPSWAACGSMVTAIAVAFTLIREGLDSIA